MRRRNWRAVEEDFGGKEMSHCAGRYVGPGDTGSVDELSFVRKPWTDQNLDHNQAESVHEMQILRCPTTCWTFVF